MILKVICKNLHHTWIECCVSNASCRLLSLQMAPSWCIVLSLDLESRDSETRKNVNIIRFLNSMQL